MTARIAIAMAVGSKASRKWPRGRALEDVVEPLGEEVSNARVPVAADGLKAPTVVGAYSLYGRADPGRFVAHELEVGLDVGAQHPRAGCLRFDAGLHVGPRLLEHLADDLGDQVVFAGEVVADHTLADAEPYRDT